MGREEDGMKEKGEIKENPVSEGSCVIYRDEEGWRGIFSFFPVKHTNSKGESRVPLEVC